MIATSDIGAIDRILSGSASACGKSIEDPRRVIQRYDERATTGERMEDVMRRLTMRFPFGL
jgi:hypothetical protein